jgi:type II secretory pathway predicted ATPase ExeA
MYENFYGFTERPFELTANPKYLYLSPTQCEALSILQYGLFSAKALTLLIGDAGTGKTTLIQAALASDLCRKVRCVYLNNPTLRSDDFIRMLALKFDLGREAGESKALLLERLETLLLERREAGQTTALVVDEAQSLSHEILEEIRFLGNIETPSSKLLPVVLAGQPELADRLEQPNLRQLKQRVTLRAMLRPFELEQTAAYIASRVVAAGGVPGRIFSLEAVRLIHEFSRGIPRTISVICDNVLLSGMALGRHSIERATVLEVCGDLHLTAQPAAISAAAPAVASDLVPLSGPSAAAAQAAGVSEPDRDDAPRKPANSFRHDRLRARFVAATRRIGRTITD